MTTLNQLAKTVAIATRKTNKTPDWDRDWAGTSYNVKLTYQGRQMTFDYYMGSAHLNPPTVADVLENLLSDASGYFNAESFEDWAGEYGYDTDSRTAERTYHAVAKSAKKLQTLLGDDFETFITADRD